VSLVTSNARSGQDVLRFATHASFEAWLEDHHASSRGVWIEIAKQHATRPTATYAEAIESALCFGWIDGQKRRGDDEHWLQRFTPRTKRSRWSQINRDKAEELIAAGRMRPSGQAEIDRARADGRWDAAYAGQRTATVPDDLQRALDADPLVAAAFAELDSRNRYSLIWRLNDAKRPETRMRRLEKYVDMLRRGERLHE
jgi:uncharacterized protein YdeI (YjbR/CyaY-like superfamily)